MRKFIPIVLLFVCRLTYSLDICAEFKKEDYLAINKTHINLKHSLYAELPVINLFKQSEYSDDIIRKLSNVDHKVYSFKTTCKDDFNVFFSVYLGDLKVDFMDGVILLESGKYYSGPHSLVNPNNDEIVIIQADKQKKPNK
jgi:hypothetical protein